jgi:hypothetical protein
MEKAVRLYSDPVSMEQRTFLFGAGSPGKTAQEKTSWEISNIGIITPSFTTIIPCESRKVNHNLANGGEGAFMAIGCCICGADVV